MKTTQFDSKTGQQFTANIGHYGTNDKPYGYHIIGDGYYIIPNPNSKYVSFSKTNKDTCLGDIVSDIIPDYTNQQYANDYGSRITGMGITVKEFLQKNCRMNIE